MNYALIRRIMDRLDGFTLRPKLLARCQRSAARSGMRDKDAVRQGTSEAVSPKALAPVLFEFFAV